MPAFVALSSSLLLSYLVTNPAACAAVLRCLPQVAPAQMALATQMMMMQGLQSPQDALNLQATMAMLNPAAMAAFNNTAITAGNMSLDPMGYPGAAYGGLYAGLGGQHMQML